MARDVSFFDELGRLVELERGAERARFEELRRGLSATERAARGVALVDLEAVDERWGLGGRLLVDFERDDRAPIEGRFGPGDLVELTPRKAEAPEPARGVVARRERARVTIAFERPPPPFVTAGRVVVDLAANDATYARARAALDGVRAWESGAPRRRRDVLLGAEPARFDPAPPAAATDRVLDGAGPTRPGGVAEAIDADAGADARALHPGAGAAPVDALNPEQRDAVERSLAARDLFLVHGPPGTGKSTVLVEVAARTVAAGGRVLATAPSNAAVDHLLELCLSRGLRALRLGHPARVAERLAAHTLDARVEAHPDRVLARELLDEAHELLGYARRQRSRGRSRERFANARDARAEASKIFDEARRLERRATRAVLADADVVCATLATLGGRDVARDGGLGDRPIDLALVDEATQAIEPIALLAFLRAPRVVLAGDHQQLAPTVLSRAAAELGLGVSLFERLLGDHGDAIRRMLREQHRMSAGIMAFPSEATYGGELRAHPSVAARRLAVPPGVDDAPVLFIDTAGTGFADELPPGSDSRRNPGEADLVVARVVELVAAGVAPSEIAVIAPYAAQVALVLLRLARAVAPDVLAALEVDTVDAFQGREKDAVLVTLTRSNERGELGFLADLRRINVAITRARRQLFVVGDSATLAAHPYYARLVEHVEAAGGYRSAWEWRR